MSSFVNIGFFFISCKFFGKYFGRIKWWVVSFFGIERVEIDRNIFLFFIDGNRGYNVYWKLLVWLIESK